MKLKILLRIIEKILGVPYNDEEPRADMYMPDRLLIMSLIFFVLGIGCTVYIIINFVVIAAIGAAVCLELGVFAMLCWRNQTIHMLSDEQFTYTTMFGNTYTYSFSDIQGLRQNQDSFTLFVAGKKVHIESMVILSERLVERINIELERLTNTKA